MPACTYCSADVAAHDPICLRDCDDNCTLLGRFCNYACLAEHIEAENLTAGASCRWQPSDD